MNCGPETPVPPCSAWFRSNSFYIPLVPFETAVGVQDQRLGAWAGGCPVGSNCRCQRRQLRRSKLPFEAVGGSWYQPPLAKAVEFFLGIFYIFDAFGVFQLKICVLVNS
jgi:hypothetical protein